MSPLMEKCQPKGWADSEAVNVILAIVCGILLGAMLGYTAAL
jgi:F0F1-type ATP synthase assembly protein I